ncbi:hypothetical protein D3C77_622120 [compost metagenome]
MRVNTGINDGYFDVFASIAFVPHASRLYGLKAPLGMIGRNGGRLEILVRNPEGNIALD